MNCWIFRSDNTGCLVWFNKKTYETFSYEFIENYKNNKHRLILTFADGLVEPHPCRIDGDDFYLYVSESILDGIWTKTYEEISLKGYKEDIVN